MIALHRGWVAIGGLAAGLGFAALVLWASAPLQNAAQTRSAASMNAPVLSFIRTGAREVALTFDDGPDPRNTPAILHLLSEYHARATFFVLGVQAKRYPGLVETIERDGNEIGSHGMSHRSLPSLKPSRVTYELSSTAGLIQELTGSGPLFFRPPYGNLSPTVLTTAAHLHETVTLWTIDTRDWAGRSAKDIAKTVLSQLRPGAIVLLHDGGGPRVQTIKALRDILQALQERGYTSVTLQRLVHDAGPRVGAATAGP
ncbi:MAG: polysaccharide deacetylase family protein [Thermaerobacter sp.]|nr:polysaccharide deacetylase family protein [Thermaerobacter sp.]